MIMSDKKICCPEQQRVGCALGGIYTALSIGGVLPILHSGPGCIVSIGSVLAGSNGGQNAVPFMESSLPCSNFCDKNVVFGGTDKLRSITKHALKYYDAELFLLAGGCSSGIICDDIGEIAAELTTEEKSVLHVQLPGFKGNNIWGHTCVLSILIDQYVAKYGKMEVKPKTVNVLGIVPHYDPMWAATLEKIESLLRQIGLEPNIIYGRGKGLQEVRQLPCAEFNLVLSPWVDLEIAQKLETRYGTPYLHFPYVPIGPTAEAEFIRSLTDYVKLDSDRSEKVIKSRNDRYNYYFDRNIVWLFDMHNLRSLPREFFINASAAAALSLTRFLAHDLGMSPRKIFIPEDVPSQYQEMVRSQLLEIDKAELDPDDIVFTDDGGLFEQYLKDVDQTVRKSVIFGSVWDDLISKKLNMPFVSVSAPYGDVLIGDKTYFGTEGAIGLISDIYNDAAAKGLMSSVL